MDLTTLLRDSGFAYDPSVFETIKRAFEQSSPEDRETFRATACAMDYKAYLRTVYWGILRGWMTEHYRTCGFCKGHHALSVHHRTYAHRGEEWNFMGDLQILCRQCHKERHGLASVKEVTEIMKRRMNAWKYPREDREAEPHTLRSAADVYTENQLRKGAL